MMMEFPDANYNPTSLQSFVVCRGFDCAPRITDELKQIEKHWSNELKLQFERRKSHGVESCYVLPMFPYPSGRLHMGHMRVYTISDVVARYYRLSGYDVIHPIGWDSFGLPAENAARDRGVDPSQWTLANIKLMKEQLTKTGVLFDWDREISTCDPKFYRWTQWLFCKLHASGLVRRCLAEVNWDPVDQTVLAAEQIDSEGRSWRSGATAEKKKLRQWSIETPRYAKRLRDGLRVLGEQWKEVADIQSNWIGECDAFRFLLPVKEKQTERQLDEFLDLRIRDIQQIAAGSFVVLRRSHPFVGSTLAGDDEPYLLPIKVLNCVTGQWMDVVVVPEKYNEGNGPEMLLDARLGDAIADANLVSMFSIEGRTKRSPMNRNDIQEIAAFGGYGGYETSRILQDWVVSRQRGWGTPIPMILSEDGKTAAAFDETQLPLLSGRGGEKIACEKLPNGRGIVEKDTLDTFFDSSWYYLRYLDPHNEQQLISKSALRGMPVNVYVGGIEHASVHMFFARFMSYFLRDIGVTETLEPFVDLIPQGVVRGKTFVVKSTGQHLGPSDVVANDDKLLSSKGEEVESVFLKMSKSKNNGVDPLEVLERDGVDLTRLQILSSAAPRAPINWGDFDVKGIKKWVDRVAAIVSQFVVARQSGKPLATPRPECEKDLRENYNYFVRNVSMCIEVLHLHNTALARLQGFTNAIRKTPVEVLAASAEGERCLKALVVMLQVFSPHVAAELWAALQLECTNVSEQQWPLVDDDAEIDFTLIVNGISCGRYPIDRRTIEKCALESVVDRAENHEHKQFLTRMRDAGLKPHSVHHSQRPGFHMTLHMSLEGDKDSNAKKISSILEALQKQKAAEIGKKRSALKTKRTEIAVS